MGLRLWPTPALSSSEPSVVLSCSHTTCRGLMWSVCEDRQWAWAAMSNSVKNGKSEATFKFANIMKQQAEFIERRPSLLQLPLNSLQKLTWINKYVSRNVIKSGKSLTAQRNDNTTERQHDVMTSACTELSFDKRAWNSHGWVKAEIFNLISFDRYK